jgi:glycosyltransferase involved in cell wall biosynthesis
MKESKVKARIALLAMGILGEDKQGQGIPVLTDLFKRLSHDFDIVFYSFGTIDASAIPRPIKVRQVVSWSIPGRLKYLILGIFFLLDHVRNPFDLLFAVSVFPPGRWAVRLGKLVKRKVLVQIIALEVVALPDIKAGYLFLPWHRKITTWVCKNTDVLIAVAEYQKKIAQLSLPTDRDIVVLPLRINPDKFPYRERQISFPVQFIHIAYYSPIKDQDTMFKAFAKVARAIDCRLTVIGSGYDVPAVPVLLKNLDIQDKVVFTGLVMQSDLPQYFDNAHILLHPARFETGCAVIQEAMASGVAVCGTEVGLLADIGDRYAVIVPPQDADLLAEKILALVGNPQDYSTITHEAYQWITKYDAVWSYQNYLNFIEEMLAR